MLIALEFKQEILAGQLFALLAIAALGGMFLPLLVYGKQVGIFGVTWLAVQLGIANLPVGTGWWQIYRVVQIAGIGFNMSLFVASLTFFDPETFCSARLSVVAGSLFPAISGLVVLWWAGN